VSRSGGGGGSRAVASATPILGSPVASFGRTSASEGGAGDVNREVSVRRGPDRVLVRSVTTPAYTWIGLPVALVLARAFVRLFRSEAGGRRINRVAAAYRRSAGARTVGGAA
jgi:hypothetical protein